ncbi:MAG TPA: hypothetical protein VJB88_05665 [Vicinamibacteria bacterium]|nr:hypothetical protein [Vicinamibacteria bacterium]
MARVKIVRCYLRSPGEAPSQRFVPLREFSLWKYYMTHHHEKIVEGEKISIWIDADSYGAEPPQQARPLEPVLRVDLHFWDARFRTTSLVQRYFPLEEYDSIRQSFLDHYPDSSGPPGHPGSRRQVHEVKGYFLLPLPHLPSA